ncbi:MAG: recombinase family protein [Planctomycetes bacterium]|nr:recombinase family protein [Planctomycetota bacterium]
MREGHIFSLQAELQLGYLTIAKRLNADGKRTRGGRLWINSSVRTILQNPTYKGDLVRGRGASKAKFFSGSDDGRVAIEKPCAGYVLEGVLPAIVSPGLWEWAQRGGAAKLAKFGGRPAGIVNWGRYLLSEFFVCGACGGSSNVGEGSTKPGKQRRYSCFVCAAKAWSSERGED